MKTILTILFCALAISLKANFYFGGFFGDGSGLTNVLSGQIYTLTPAASAGGTNFYWMDCGKVNVQGGIYSYATLGTSNVTVDLMGPTNAVFGSLLSFNVVCNGGSNDTILLPDSLPHLNTNGLTHSAPFYSLVLTNGNEFRGTLQSNYSLSFTWATFGQ